MPQKDREILSGTLYLNNEPIMQLEKCYLVYEETEQELVTIPNDSVLTKEQTLQFENLLLNRNTLLSLLFGRKVTNNWLKMHGGVMTRKKGIRNGSKYN